MPHALSLVNTVSSTSIPVEIAATVNDTTDSRVTVGAMLQDQAVDLDPDIDAMDLRIRFFGGTSNFDPAPYRRLEQHLRTHPYDIVHTHHNFTGSIARAISKIKGLSIINTEHNDHRHFSLAQRAVNAATYALPDVNVYNSHSTRNSLDAITRAVSQRDEVIYNGIDSNRINRGANYPLPFELPDKTLITNIGVMTAQKNQHVILAAVQHLKQMSKIGDLHFVIAGSGPLETDLRSSAIKLGVDDHVMFTGYLPEREHVYRLLHESDLFLTPSRYEGFCVAAVEAMACGLPVIASDNEVFREVIGDQGSFVHWNRSDILADEILMYTEELDADLVEERRKGLRERALSKFPIKETARGYHELYCDIAQ